jgi:hypothetical protein
MNKLGKAEYYESGDAGEYEKRIHYLLKKENVYITFLSGEMGSGTTILEAIISLKKPKEKYTINNSISFSSKDFGGIKLGISRTSFFKFISPRATIDTSSEKSNKIEFLNKIPMTENEIKKLKVEDKEYQFYDESIYLHPFFEKSKLTELLIGRVTSW